MNTAQNTAKSAKNLAQAVAKQMAREPLEILKEAKEQTTGEETSRRSDDQTSGGEDQKKLLEHQNEIQDKMKSGRRMEALNRELDDIHRQKVFKELQARIAAGEEIPLEEYSELTMEQKQVLKAQMEAKKIQESRIKNQDSGLREPAVKKGRQLFNFGKKQAMKQEQTRVEKPVPPSG